MVKSRLLQTQPLGQLTAVAEERACYGLTRGGGALFFSTELAQFPMPGPLRQLVTCAQARCQLAGDGSVCQLSGVQPLDPTDSIHQSSPGQLRTQLRERDREREGERLSRRGAHAGFNLKLRRESATCFQTAADFFLWVLGQFANCGAHCGPARPTWQPAVPHLPKRRRGRDFKVCPHAACQLTTWQLLGGST